MPADIFGDAPPRPADGTKRPRSPAARANATQSVTQLSRITAVANDPSLYALAARLPTPQLGVPGRPGEFPPYVYVLFNALTAVFHSARNTASNLADPGVWAVVRQGIAANLGQDAADVLPDTGPTRNQWLYNRRLLLKHLPDLLDEFRQQALSQALAQGLLDPAAPRSWTNPGQTQLVVGDGTVAKSPVRAREATSIDKRTGQVRHHRIDPGAGEHREGGDGGTLVWGPKFVFASARNSHYHERVILDLRYQPPKHAGGEAALAVECLLDLQQTAPGMLGAVWDGALRGKHRNSLAQVGLLAINKQHGGALPERLPAFRGTTCHHDLWSVDGRVAEHTFTDDGTAEYRPIPIARLEMRKGADSCRWYHVLKIPCLRGPDHEHRIRLDQNDADTNRDFNTAEHLRQIPPGTATFDRLYGYRPDSESLNAVLDTTWRHKRIIAFGAERQTLVVLGFAQSQNAISRRVHLKRLDREAAQKL